MGLLDNFLFPQAPKVQDVPNFNLSDKNVVEAEIKRLQKIIETPNPAPEQKELSPHLIDKRIAAIEVIRVLWRFRIWALASAILLIAAPAICLLNWIVGASVGIIGAGVAGFYYFRVDKEILFLKNKYGV